ncbi:MAG TPA: tetratricopeptide repeat protein [Gaiellales bacterium]|jgi:putative thioredoxin|nr:tetratricopeptide repeat protein [Gaiellales bacterium]
MAIDVDEAGFDQAVIERSRSVPVLVDFWAEWCGPCHMLAPVIERAVDAADGAVELVKVDIDANPGIARRYGIQGIPNVKAFRAGELVDEFTGAQPPAVVERFVQGLIPKPEDALLANGDEQSLREAIELDPTRADVRVRLARLLLADGREDEALELLAPVAHDCEADGLLARAELAADPVAPPVARMGLEALARGEYEAALRALLEAVSEASGETRDRIRRVMVGAFAELGDSDPLAASIRKRLAASLY